MRSRTTGLIALALTCVPALASPPIPSDIALHLNVVSEAAAPYPPGSTGALELTVTRLSGSPPRFSIDTTGTLLPLASPAPIRFAPTESGDACDLQEVTDRPYVDGRYWWMLGSFGADGQATCRIAFEVLDAAAGSPVRLRFQARAFSGLSAGYIDTNPDDNVADFVFGPSGSLPVPVPVPGPTALAWLFAATALLAAGLRALMSGSAPFRRGFGVGFLPPPASLRHDRRREAAAGRRGQHHDGLDAACVNRLNSGSRWQRWCRRPSPQ